MAVIFDCDGVLVDTELLVNRCFAAALNRIGLPWTVEETMRQLVGRSMKSCVAIIESETGRKLPPDFLARLQADTFESFRTAPVRPVAGIVDVLDWLEEKEIAYCVASSKMGKGMYLIKGLKAGDTIREIDIVIKSPAGDGLKPGEAGQAIGAVLQEDCSTGVCLKSEMFVSMPKAT